MNACVVTGAAAGIGRAIAAQLVAEGVHVVAVDWDGSTLERTAAELGEAVTPLVGDVGDWETHERAADAAERAGTLAHWVNNAGIDVAGGAHEVTPEEIERGLRVLQLGVMYGTAVAVRRMLPRRSGSIVNVSSIQGTHAFPRYFMYQAAKAAVIMISKGVAVDYGPFGLRCNAVLPGTIATPMTFAGLPPELSREEALAAEGELTRSAASAVPRRWPRSRASCSPTGPRSSAAPPSRSTAPRRPAAMPTPSRTRSALPPASPTGLCPDGRLKRPVDTSELPTDARSRMPEPPPQRLGHLGEAVPRRALLPDVDAAGRESLRRQRRRPDRQLERAAGHRGAEGNAYGDRTVAHVQRPDAREGRAAARIGQAGGRLAFERDRLRLTEERGSFEDDREVAHGTSGRVDDHAEPERRAAQRDPGEGRAVRKGAARRTRELRVADRAHGRGGTEDEQRRDEGEHEQKLLHDRVPL